MKKNSKKTKLGQGLIKAVKSVIKKEKKKVRLSSQKVYFVTVISPYEEVHKEKTVDLKAMNKELKKIKASKDLSPFMKGLRRRTAIHDHLKQTVDVYNPYGKQQGYRRHRTSVFFFSKKNAITAIKENYADILEGGSNGNPSIVLIEEYYEGYCLVEKRWFFQAIVDRETHKIAVKSIEEPLWAKGSCNYAVG